MFSLTEVTLRKITNDKSVKYIPENKQTQDRDVKPDTIKKNSLPRKQDKKISLSFKKIIEKIAAGGFGYYK